MVPGSYNGKGHLRAFLTKFISNSFQRKKIAKLNYLLLPSLKYGSIRSTLNHSSLSPWSEKQGKGWPLEFNMVPLRNVGKNEKQRDGSFHISILPIQTLTPISSRHCFSQRQLKLEILAEQLPTSSQYLLVFWVTKTKWRDLLCRFKKEKNFKFLCTELY